MRMWKRIVLGALCLFLSLSARPQSKGVWLGLADDAYEERSVRLGAGDRLYLYSDGVPEAMDPAGTPFGA